jgi:hydroxyacid-oxoacid transhydrogenase
MPSMKAKTGIANKALKPTLALIDPDNTAHAPAPVAAASGFDVLCHALESYTALPFNERGPRPATPSQRATYQGANPIADVWSLMALRLLARSFIPSVKDRADEEANAEMTLAATYAGFGLGNAGVHLCHGMSYAISGLNKTYQHPAYLKPMVPHGISVVLSAPSVFQFTAPTNPSRHLEAARILSGENPPVRIHMYSTPGQRESVRPSDKDFAADAGKILADQILRFMDVMRVPDGLSAIGYSESDITALVQATLPQKRVLSLAPAGSTGEDELSELFKNSMRAY